MLVKEAKKRREQVESLMKAKEALESELALSSNEKSKLETEFGKISDGKAQMAEMGGFVDGLVREKNGKEKETGVLKRERRKKGAVVCADPEKEEGRREKRRKKGEEYSSLTIKYVRALHVHEE
ncbi:myosin-2 heavy chain [Salix suchowensis]|nr:myosin-2 heavy chain [Salix suchowensis]